MYSRYAPWRLALAAGIAALTLTGCKQGGEDQPGNGTASASSTAGADDTAAYVRPSETTIAEPSTAPAAAAPSASRDPAEVLLAWAKAVSLKDWAGAYAYWGNHGADSGMTLAEFSGQWGKLGQPDLELGKGQQEGAAGSSFYSAPVTIVDGKRRIRGEVVLRRVNDVDGASPEQLRWHIESTTLKP